MKYPFTNALAWKMSAICMVTLLGPMSLSASTVTIIDLGNFNTTGNPAKGSSTAKFINNEGDVAGFSSLDLNTHHAFLYSSLTNTMTDLGTFGGTNSDTTGLNATGMVSGTADLSISGNDVPHAFLYQAGSTGGYQNGPLKDLGTLGGTNSGGGGLNDAGIVVGNSLVDQSNTHAMASVSPNDLGTLVGSYAEADYINNNGQIAGYSAAPGGSFAFYLPTIRPLVASDALTLGGNSSVAKGINAIGQVIGVSNLVASSTVQHGFIYTPGDASPLDLGTLNPAFANGSSDAEAINSAGQVVGRSDLSVSQHHAYLSSLVGNSRVMTDLGTLNGGLGNSTADAINTWGDVVGTATNSAGATVPFLYTNGQMIDLNALIQAAGSDFTKLLTATGINDSGMIIGQGKTSSGAVNAYVLTYSAVSTPEPSTVACMLLGLLFCSVGLIRKGKSNAHRRIS